VRAVLINPSRYLFLNGSNFFGLVRLCSNTFPPFLLTAFFGPRIGCEQPDIFSFQWFWFGPLFGEMFFSLSFGRSGEPKQWPPLHGKYSAGLPHSFWDPNWWVFYPPFRLREIVSFPPRLFPSPQYGAAGRLLRGGFFTSIP